MSIILHHKNKGKWFQCKFHYFVPLAKDEPYQSILNSIKIESKFKIAKILLTVIFEKTFPKAKYTILG